MSLQRKLRRQQARQVPNGAAPATPSTSIILTLEQPMVEYLLQLVAERPIKEAGGLFNVLRQQFTAQVKEQVRRQLGSPSPTPPQEVPSPPPEET